MHKLVAAIFPASSASIIPRESAPLMLNAIVDIPLPKSCGSSGEIINNTQAGTNGLNAIGIPVELAKMEIFIMDFIYRVLIRPQMMPTPIALSSV